MKSQEAVVLVHGFNKTGTDMLTLKDYLARKGYSCLIINLPTRFCTVEQCSDVLETSLKEIIGRAEYQKIHFIGHSMGGLIIRNTVERFDIPRIGRCIFIATPNKGSYFADIVQKVFPPALKVIKSLSDLRTSCNTGSLKNGISYPEIGVIAGNKCNLILGKLLKEENDGRVEVDSTKIDIMKDFTVQPYGHKEIHHKPEIAELVDTFLTYGSFYYPDKSKLLESRNPDTI